jgi:tRNA threonylcarbamoyl adenosine modification protein (Sua5/YciO/YrdC/YwlC family)
LPAEIIKIDRKNYQKEMLAKAAKVLAGGGLVAFPTETVYGLGTNGNMAESVRKLTEIKNSPQDRPFTFHLASADDIYQYTKNAPRLATRLMRVFWPGPLTMVLPDSKNGWIGLRTPDHIMAYDLIRLANIPVIATSANIAGQEPPLDAQTIIKTLGDKIDVIIDAGPAKGGVSSTVVKITSDNKFELLREGPITKDDIERFTYKMIIFICSGNTCRSPMAMGLCQKMLADKLKIPVSKLESNGYKVISAGTSAIYSAPASNTAVSVMREIGVDIRDHRSQPVTLTMLDEADEVYVMTKGHFTTLKEWVPLLADRIRLLDPYGENIDDPIVSNREAYLKALAKIQNGIKQLLK